MRDRGGWIAIHFCLTSVGNGGEFIICRAGQPCRKFSEQSGDQNAQVGQGEGTSGRIHLVDGRCHGARIGNRAEMVNLVVLARERFGVLQPSGAFRGPVDVRKRRRAGALQNASAAAQAP